MQLTISSVFLSVLLAGSFVSAAPLEARHKNKMRMGNKVTSSVAASAAGAAYFITNEPDGNFIVAAAIGTDGKLTLRSATSTEGGGNHGLPGLTDPDALFTQGAIKASAASSVLATVNAGSNTISVFDIDSTDPTTLKMIGKPIGSGGEFPVSLALNKAGDRVCALNGGQVNGVACFSIDKTKGLAPIANTVRSLNLNQTTPANGPAGTVSHVVFSEDNTKLIASVKGLPPTPGILAVWDIADDGSLSQDFQAIQPAKGGLLPFSMTVIPGKNAILATDAGLGVDIFDMSADAKANNDVAAGQSSTLAIDGQKATCWSSLSTKTGTFFVTDIGTSTVTEISLDDNLKPSIVKQYPQGDNSGTIDNDIATVNGNDFLYVLAANATQVKVLSLPSAGKATALQTLDLSAPAKAAGLSLNGANIQGMTSFIKKA